VKMFDTRKTRMIGLSCGEETDNMLSRFDRIPERGGQTDRRTGGQADRIAISMSRVSVPKREKNRASSYTVRLLKVKRDDVGTLFLPVFKCLLLF